MKKLILSTIILLFIFSACEKTPGGKKNPDWNPSARFPDTVVNLSDINSPYDDYNSVLPETHFGKALIFSSNRRTSGGDFDLIGEIFHAAWYWETGELIVDDSYFWQETNWVAKLLNKMPSSGNQFGPYSISFDTLIDGTHKIIHLLACSNDNGSYSYQEEFVYQESSLTGVLGEVKGPLYVAGVSDPHKQYVSFYGPAVFNIDLIGINANDFTQMYFNKTIDGKSKIFRINIPSSMNFLQFLTDTIAHSQEIVPELNSEGNDFCPFVNGNFMVFTSDRAGGFGGYDLYYSYFDGTTWSEPINFGEKINTPYDEFRPVPVNVQEFQNDLLIFSSNRPGGLGGFDLYYVGIAKFGPQIIIDK
ncbi:MAG TPA: hypothetical protein VIN10_07425 [Bacteroidales bacterium]